MSVDVVVFLFIDVGFDGGRFAQDQLGIRGIVNDLV